MDVCRSWSSQSWVVQDWDKAVDCRDSALHSYMIVSLVLNYVSAANSAQAINSKKTVVKIFALGASFLISTTTMIWGYIEVFDKACGDGDDGSEGLKGTLLWYIGIATASLHALTVLICLLGVGIPMCIAFCDS